MFRVLMMIGGRLAPLGRWAGGLSRKMGTGLSLMVNAALVALGFRTVRTVESIVPWLCAAFVAWGLVVSIRK